MAYNFVKILQDCRKKKNPAFALRAHSEMCSNGLEAHPAIGNYLVSMFVDCGSLIDAERVFVKLIQRNELSWTSLIRGFTESGKCLDTFHLFHSMQMDQVPASAFTFRVLIKACSRLQALREGHYIYMETVRESCESDSFVGNSLVDMYAKCGSLADAQGVFNKLEHRDVVSWTSLIGGYREAADNEEVLQCWDQMQHEKVSPNVVTYASVLLSCGSTEALDKGCEIHSDAVKNGFEQDSFVGNALINMYGKHGALLEAKEVLEEMLVKDVVSWTTLIAAYAKHGFFNDAQECLVQMKEGGVPPNLVCWNAVISEYAEHGLGEVALQCMEKMQQESIYPDIITLTSITKACGKAKCISRGRTTHSQIMKMGREKETFVGNALVDMYGKCGSLVEARGTFDGLEDRDVISWTCLISGNAEHGLIEEANNCLSEMQQKGIPITITTWNAVIAAFAEVGLGEEALKCFKKLRLEMGVPPDEVTYTCTLKACCRIGAIDSGRDIHAEVVNVGFESDPFVASSLIDMYAKCGTLVEAQEVFAKVPVKDPVLWNILVIAYADHGLGEEVVKCIQQMQQDCMGLSTLPIHSLKACDNIGDIMMGQKLHIQMIKQGLEGDITIGNVLITMYANHLLFLEAHSTLDHFSMHRDVASWNALIAAYSGQSIGSEDIRKCLKRMELDGVSPDSTTYVWSLKCAATFEALSWGQKIHCEIVKAGFETESSTCISLVEFYANHGSFAEANNVANQLIVFNEVASWMALCVGYEHNNLSKETLDCLKKMQQKGFCMKPNMFVMGLKACGAIKSLAQGHELHSDLVKHGLETHSFIGNTMINMYANCGSIVEARAIFDNILSQNLVSWNAVIKGYAENGLGEEALNCSLKMEAEGVKMDAITIVSVLKVCGSLGMAEKGREKHMELIKYGLETECNASGALIDMYVKCGLLKEASEVFSQLIIGDVVSSTAMISGYACQGKVKKVLSLVSRMKRKGIQEDSITILSVLTSCSHAGLVDRGCEYFRDVRKDNKAFLADEHYNCLIDLMARAGQLDKAIEVIESMPLQPKPMMWMALLGACRKWGNVELARYAFISVVELSSDDKQATPFVLMLNIYGDSYMYEDA